MDDFFNHDVAEWITKSMSRMDPDEAEMFGLFLVNEVYWADRENNARTIDRYVEDIHKALYRDTTDPVAKRMVQVISKEKTPFEERFGKPQPRGFGGKWVKISAPGFRFEKVEGGGGPKAGYYPRNSKESSFDLTSALATAGEETTAFQQHWNSQGGKNNERTYNRIRGGAQLTQALGVASGNPNLYAAGKVGDFVGEFGPEAEKVIGPAARKTAYRYRGTERTPDTEIENLHDEMLSRRLRGEGLSTKDITPELRANAAEFAAITYLGSQLPQQSLSELQLKSGKVPPSQGVMIDDEGDIVAQAVGYNEDHYIPFNLKNLKQLKGGSYVRTRSTGGLTTEDIYTGLLSGARSVTVVSRSGVFTLDFDDELRGGRRYSDKAHQMVGRYAHLLDAVQSKDVVRERLAPEERAEIRANVEDEMKGADYTAKEIEDEIRNREKEYISGARYSESEVRAIDEKAREIAAEYNGLQGQKFDQIVSHTGGQMLKGQDYKSMPRDYEARVRAIKSELMDDLMERKSKRKYQLDGEGYAAAMDALKEQYPYFIQHVEYKPYREVNGRVRPPTNEQDSGYVMPNYNRPAAAMSGFYAEEIEGAEKGKGKYSASQTNYQNYRNSKGQAIKAVPVEGEEAKGDKKAGSRHSRSLQIKQGEALMRAGKVEAKALDRAGQIARGLMADSATARAKYRTLAEWDKDRNPTEGMTTKERQAFKKELKGLRDQLMGVDAGDRAGIQSALDELSDAIRALDEIEDQMSSEHVFNLKDFDVRRTYRVPPKMEDKEEYVEGGKAAMYQEAWDRLNRGKRPEERIDRDISDADLKQHQESQGKLAGAADDLLKEDNDDNRTDFIKAAIAAGRKAQITRVLEELDDPETEVSDTLKRIAEGSRKETERALRLRRIKHVAKEKLTAEGEAEAKAAASGETAEGKAIDNALASDNPKVKRAYEFKDSVAKAVYMRVSNHENLDDQSTQIGKGIAMAIEEQDEDAMFNQMQELEAHNPKFYNAMRMLIVSRMPQYRRDLGLPE